MITVDFNTGNFTLAIAGELSEEAIAKKLVEGVRYAVQRDVASKVYIKLAGKPNAKGTLTLPKDFERDSIPFSVENAAEFQKLAEAELNKLGSFTVKAVENVGGEAGAPGKMAIGLWAKPQARFLLGLDDDATDEEGIEAARVFLASLKGKKA